MKAMEAAGNALGSGAGGSDEDGRARTYIQRFDVLPFRFHAKSAVNLRG
jgi:hypothetical protein